MVLCYDFYKKKHVLIIQMDRYRIYTKSEGAVGSSQFGFRRDFGTREALVATQVLVRR